MEALDINGYKRNWERIRNEEFKSGVIDGLSKHNAMLCIAQLKDFENGLNTTTKGIRQPASLLRIRYSYKELSKRVGIKTNIDEISKEKITQIFKIAKSKDFVRNTKPIYTWLKRTGRIKENPTEHILTEEFSNGKPAWVYLGEEGIKKLLNSLGGKHKALTTLLYDSGMRPEEAWKIRVFDFQDDFKVLDIPDKRENGEKVAKKNSFGRKIKLKLCSEIIKEFIENNHLEKNDLLFDMTQAGFNKALRVQTKKIFGVEPTKARESPDKITSYDIRHNSACYWLKRYKTHRDLMYRFGWKSEDKIFYYTEFLDMRDTIDDEDLITPEDKNKMQKEIDRLKKDLENQSIKNFEKLESLGTKMEQLDGLNQKLEALQNLFLMFKPELKSLNPEDKAKFEAERKKIFG